MIVHGSIPCTRATEPGIRRARLVAAQSYAPHSVPRIAILLGQWDGGSIVGAARNLSTTRSEGRTKQ